MKTKHYGVSLHESPRASDQDPEVMLRLEDVDKDGDADLALYVHGLRVYSIQASTLWENVQAEFKRVAKRARKAVKK